MNAVLDQEPAMLRRQSGLNGGSTETVSDILRLLALLPVPCRIVNADRKVIWESPALATLLQSAEQTCCESLGIRHHDADCVTLRTLRSARSQSRNLWLGQSYVSIETMLLPDLIDGPVSFEFFTDITVEKRLEGAFIQQQELLEATNKAMIEINHHLEAMQQELQEKNGSLEQANSQLRSLDKMKDEFISIVSHELKAPLTSIKASVELIQTCDKDRLSPNGNELLTICRRNTDRLNTMVKDLLDIARIESGRLSLKFEPFSIADAVRDCFLSVRTLADQKSLELINSVPMGLAAVADYERLVQALINLVNNAIKFTDRGSVTVEGAVDESHLILCVRDTGIGIEPDAQTAIFDKFSQVGSALHRNSTGTGLGLSIVRGIVREHGGEICVQSEPGQGSCFTMMIPQPPGKDSRDVSGPLD